MPRRYTYGVDIDDSASSSAARMAANLKREFGKIQGDLDETGSDAQKLARTIDASADTIAGDIRRVESAAEALAAALGPEMADRIDTTDAVLQFQRVGVQLEDVEAHAEELAAALSKLENVAGTGGRQTAAAFDDVDDASRRVGDTTEKTRSVVANFAGNASQDIPGVAGSFGALNVAVGQFAEYMTEGDIKMKKMLSSGLALGAAVAIFAGITGHMNRIAESKALDREQIDGFTDAILEGKNAAAVLADQLRETGKVEFGIGEMGRVDFAEPINELGLTVEQFTGIASRSRDEIVAWGEAQKDAGADAGAVDAVLIALGHTAENLATAEERAAITTELLGGSAETTAEKIEANSRALERNIEVMNARNDAIRGAADADLAFRDAIDAAEDALGTYTEAVAVNGAASEEADDASRDLERAIYDAGEAARVSAETQATAAGRGANATQEGVTAQLQTLQNLANGLNPGSPVRNAIEGHIAALYLVPRNIDTEVRLRVNSLTGGAANWFGGGRAAGGPVREGGMYEVNENGSELLHENGRTYLMAGANGSVEPLQAGSAGSAASMPPIVVQLVLDGRQIDESLVRLKRANGGLGFEKS